MIQITEASITNAKPLKFWYSLWFSIKEEDLPEEEYKKLRKMWQDWTPIAIVLQDFQKEEVKKEVKSTQLLHNLMQKYCDNHNIDMQEERTRICKKYNIQSRADMREEDIQAEIESYRLGLYE